jgi:hypothetical protein
VEMKVEDKTPQHDPQDPVYNMSLLATRLQQAERVRNAVKLLQSRLSKARLRRIFRRHPDKTIKQLSKDYPMYKLYQVRALALYDKTYAGCIGVIGSYLDNGGVTFVVMYDRPGHAYSDPNGRHAMDPEWLEEITLRDFEAVVKKDNPTVVLS